MIIQSCGLHTINEEVCGCSTVHACMCVCTCVLSDIRVYMYVQSVKLIHSWLLCHLQVYHLMESIELVARWQNVQVLTPGTNIRRLIVEDVIKSKSILSCREAITHCIPTKYEAYSVELLQVITDLWIMIMIHGHSFAKDWTIKFVRKEQERHWNRNSSIH